jgi:glycosyltransferase involved in cell wall biosynthesis
MKRPLISIITSTYNSAKTLNDTLVSVLNQTYSNIEYIIVDGASTDGTVEILKAQQQQFKNNNIRFKWISEPDTGIYNAWNKALKMIAGDWVVFIGSDDYFKNNTVFEEMLPFLNQSEENGCNYVYGKIEHVDKNEQLIEVAGKPWSLQKKRFTYTMNLGHSGCFHHKNLFTKHGNFDDSFKIVGDYEFLLREFKNPNNNAFFVDKSLIIMREGGVSASLDNRLTIVKENHKARKLNGITAFSKELFFWELRVRGIVFITKIFGVDFAAKAADFYRKVFLKKQKRWSV